MSDPITTTLIVGTLLGAGTGVAASKMSQPKIPQNPSAPDITPTDTAEAMASRRAERQGKKAAAAFGRSDTILTGPEGLGNTVAGMAGGGNTGAGMAGVGKTLLGQ